MMWKMMWIFLLLVLKCECMPVTPSPEPAEDKTDSADEAPKKAKLSCYFNIKRKTVDEISETRRTTSDVSTSCSGEEHEMSSYVSIAIANGYGTLNALDMFLVRGAGIFVKQFGKAEVLRWKGRFICDHHINELWKQWNKIQFKHVKIKHSGSGDQHAILCGFPQDGHERSLGDRNTFYVSKDDAQRFMRAKGTLLHVGLPICHEHKMELTALQDADFDPDFVMMEEELSSGEEEGTCPADTFKTLFVEFAKAANFDRLCTKGAFSQLQSETQQKKIRVVKKLNDHVAEIVAPGEEDMFTSMMIDSYTRGIWSGDPEKKFEGIMFDVAKEYDRTTSRKERLLILSLAASVVPYAEVEKYIHGLPTRQYYNARKFERRAIENPDDVQHKHKETYIFGRVNLFNCFLTQPEYSIGLPSGTLTGTLSSGAKIDYPNVLRVHTTYEIMAAYDRYLEQTGQTDMKLGSGTMYNILKTCGATQRKQMTCVDNILVDGLKGFADIDKIIISLREKGKLNGRLATDLTKMFEESKQYYRTDFRTHTVYESKVADHCFLWALSDPNGDPRFAVTENHVHDYVCPRCHLLERGFSELNDVLTKLDQMTKASDQFKKDLAEMKITMTASTENILDLKRHQLRSAFTTRNREEIIASLKNNEALITIDWAMKWLPAWATEGQRQFYAKRGIPWHVTHIHALVNGHLVQHTFVHVLSTDKQNSQTVTQMLEHVLEQLYIVGIRAVHIRSDNGGCYHSSATIASIPKIAARTLVRVKSVSFSEVQNGKSSADRMMAQVKRKLHNRLASGEDVSTDEEFVTGVLIGKMINGLSIYLVAAEEVEESTFRINKISDYNYFEYPDPNTVRVWKFKGIGRGIALGGLKENGGKLEILTEGGYVAKPLVPLAENEQIKDGGPTHFWYSGLTSVVLQPSEGDDDSDDESVTGAAAPVEAPTSAAPKETRLFTCPTCGSSFLLYRNLVKHSAIGTCKKRPERIGTYDYALGLYKEKLEERDLSRLEPALGEVVNSFQQPSGTPTLERGWAMKKRRICIRLSPKSTAWVEKIYNEGDRTGHKIDPYKAEKLMAKDPTILPEERLNNRQIASYYSRLAVKQKEAGRPKRAMEEEESCECEDDGIAFQYEDNQDYFFRVINENKGKLFDMTLPVPNVPYE